MINLCEYIKHTTIKENFKESCIIISNLEESEDLAYDISMGTNLKSKNIIFENSSYKNHFMDILNNNIIKYNVINCDSSLNRIREDIKNIDYEFVIFDHVNKCQDLNILNINNSNKIKCIYIC